MAQKPAHGQRSRGLDGAMLKVPAKARPGKMRECARARTSNERRVDYLMSTVCAVQSSLARVPDETLQAAARSLLFTALVHPP